MKNLTLAIIALSGALGASAPAIAQATLDKSSTKIFDAATNAPNSGGSAQGVSTTMSGNPEGFSANRGRSVQTSMSGNPEG